MRFLSCWLAAVLILLTQPSAHAAGRVALVIGNGAYINANPLPNPTNDASDMTAALQALGFTVIGGNDLDYAAMGAKIGEFEDAARDADVTLLFYAGHGMQVNGRNFLVPVNAKLERESSLQFEAIDAETVLRSMAGPGKTAIALLDACRDNPLSRRFARSLGATRSSAVQQGLAVPAISGGGMLIGFATSPGDVAADGDGRNSPFTTALLKNINTPGLEIQQMMTRVKADVFTTTKESQEPWHNSSLRNEVFLVAPQQIDPPKEDLTPTPRTTSIEVEWNAVKDTGNMAVLDAFMLRHADNPVFSALAQDRKDELQRKANSEILDSLMIKKNIPPPPEVSATEKIKKLALNDQSTTAPVEVPKQSGSSWTLNQFFETANAANEGNTTYALLGPDSVDIPVPAKNSGSKNRSFTLTEIARAPAMDVLLSANSQLSFTSATSESCLLHWVDRCSYLSKEFFDGLSAAMTANGLDIMNGFKGYFRINRIAGSSDYLLSNNPASRDGQVAIVAAIVSEDLQVKQMLGFDLSAAKLKATAGSAESDIAITWSAIEGDDLYVSFDATHRCTDKPRKFGFIVKFSLADRIVKWVSPFSVSDINFVMRGDHIISASGGSCVDDFAYKLDKATGEVLGRFKTPTAVERMDGSGDALVFELYEGAVAYQAP